MDNTASTRMVDILSLETTRVDSGSLFLLLPLLILSLLYLALRYYRQPLRRLRRDLLHGQLTPRQAAHQLAGLIELDKQQTADLQTLRFSRAEPGLAQILDFIQQIREN